MYRVYSVHSVHCVPWAPTVWGNLQANVKLHSLSPSKLALRIYIPSYCLHEYIYKSSMCPYICMTAVVFTA